MLRPSIFKQFLAFDLSSIGGRLHTLRSPVAKSKPFRPVPHSVRIRRLMIECLEQRVVFNVDIATGVPALHGNPGAAASLYLDFNGHFEPVWGTYNNVTTPAYDIDGDATTFNDRELSNIRAIWQGVVEDYAPFNINVTTVQPSVLAPGTPIANANRVALRVAIGGNASDWFAPGTTGLGGYSYIGSFTNSIANVAYVFAANQDVPISTGDIVSHEAGHAFGLEHQYSASTATWQSIMTVGAVHDFSTWSNGPLVVGGPQQDDIAILAGATNGFGYRSDDRGDTAATATSLASTGNAWSGSGIVGTNTDVDMFAFTVAVGDTYRVAVNGDSVSPNLDAVVELRSSSGLLLTSANPQDSLNAQLVRYLAPGSYTLAVKGSGTYGWIGQYGINIDNSPVAGITVNAASGAMITGEDGRQASFSLVLQTAPTSDVTIPISSSNTAEGTVSTASIVFTFANWDIPQILTVTGVSDGVLGDDIAYNIIVGAAISSDVEYSGRDVADIATVNLDNSLSGFIYFHDTLTQTIKRSRLTGSQPETLVDLNALNGGSGLGNAYDLAVDLVGGKMYWRVWSGSVGFIQRANLDGSAVENVISGVTGGSGFALDAVAGKLYWFNNSVKKIQRANLDGTAMEDVLAQAGMTVGGIALDTVNNKIYWTDPIQDNIQRANLDGTNTELLWTGIAPTSPYAIALDVGAGKIYWSDTDQDVIRRANLDGSNVAVLADAATASGSLDFVRGLALDIPAGKLYWSNWVAQSAVYRANLDGSVISSIEAAQYPRGLAIVHPAPGISVTHRTGLTTSELGGSNVFRVALNTQPTANVTIAVSSSDTTEGTVSNSLLTFTPANWFVTQTVTVQGVDDTLGDGNIAYTIVLAAAVSADTNYSGVDPADAPVVNLDKPTKFYVVNDATQNLNYEYTANGGLVESYSLNSANASPRGAASTAVGTTVWVVDANRIVYVYNNSGVLLGSWSAGTLASNATPEGIATNGTDVWIVDSKSDKVYKYAGAATRLSGSQTAAGSFNLNSSNSSPKDIVTDGTSLWVVNDSSTDKVFKYSVAGSLQGSWTLSTSGASSPTGITIDPSNVSNIWIVDNGSKLVYQYTASATLTSGSLEASTTFALAAGNTNPQGIADPPSPLSILVAGSPKLAASVFTDQPISTNDRTSASMPVPMVDRGVGVIDSKNVQLNSSCPAYSNSVKLGMNDGFNQTISLGDYGSVAGVRSNQRPSGLTKLSARRAANVDSALAEWDRVYKSQLMPMPMWDGQL